MSSRINEKDLSSWEARADEVRTLEATVQGIKEGGDYVSPLSFRGQSDANWTLSTTLERFNPQLTSMLTYYYGIRAAKAQVEAHTERRLELPSIADYTACMNQSKRQDWKIGEEHSPFPGYEFFAYMRHHGFDAFNVNAFSLFGSEDAMMETIARRELPRKKSLVGRRAWD